MQKHEWRKEEKQFYLPKPQPEVIDLPAFPFLVIAGEGNPNSEAFAHCITALYSVSYAVKMQSKRMDPLPDGHYDYTVYPLEGVWDLKRDSIPNPDGSINKDDLIFNLMIRQPDFASADFVQEMIELTKSKKPSPMLEYLRFETITDGPCVQMLHYGSFDDEPASFRRMENFATEQGLLRLSKVHREIYLSDFRKVPAEKLKTVLRFKVKSVAGG